MQSQINRLLTLPAYHAEQGLCNSRASIHPSVPSIDRFAAEHHAGSRYQSIGILYQHYITIITISATTDYIY